MKVVINSCFGGFGLSDKAIKLCIERGMKCRGEKDKDRGEFFTKLSKKSPISKTNYFIEDYHDRNGFRSHPTVVAVVEELGERANGFCADLRVVEIPFDSTEGWSIDEYDGNETVEEDHRSWR